MNDKFLIPELKFKFKHPERRKCLVHEVVWLFINNHYGQWDTHFGTIENTTGNLYNDGKRLLYKDTCIAEMDPSEKKIYINYNMPSFIHKYVINDIYKYRAGWQIINKTVEKGVIFLNHK